MTPSEQEAATPSEQEQVQAVAAPSSGVLQQQSWRAGAAVVMAEAAWLLCSSLCLKGGAALGPLLPLHRHGGGSDTSGAGWPPSAPSSLSIGGSAPWRIRRSTCVSGEDAVDPAVSGVDEADPAWAQPDPAGGGQIPLRVGGSRLSGSVQGWRQRRVGAAV
jgi:hypothetical protein